MYRRRSLSRDARLVDPDVQLSLAMELPPRSKDSPQAMPEARERAKRSIESEPILWMRDVLELTGVHRSTIHRWIAKGSFPQKDAPKARPAGWRRSTYERWLRGPAPSNRVSQER